MQEEIIITHPNKRKGNNYENRFVKRMLKEGAVSALRHFGSIGITDVEWVDKNGNRHEAQLKFSGKKPYISTDEYGRLFDYAQQHKGISTIWLIMKAAYKKESWEKLN